MITRPLDLAARLTPVSRGWDALFYVNTGLLAVFFLLFGSRFVLSPGLALDFELPKATAAATSARITDVVIAVPAAGMAVVDGAVVDYAGLGEWLRTKAKAEAPGPRRLLVHAAGGLPARDLSKIYDLAADAGFAGVLIATDEMNAGGI